MSQDRPVASATACDGARELELAAVTDRGPVRTENQDVWAMPPLTAGVALLVADGMGGHAHGGIAAQLAVTAAAQRLERGDDPHAALAEAVLDGNDAILHHRRDQAHGELMGTTMVAAVIADGRISLANVGDSRGYLLRGGMLRQMTRDHSWVEEEVRAGRLDAAAAAIDPRRNVLSRALTGEPVEVDLFELPAEPGDLVMLCTDGAWGPLGDHRLADRLLATAPLPDMLVAACDAALDAGGTDNVTLAACRIGQG